MTTVREAAFAGGGLGYGSPASLGVQMAQTGRQVVCVLGEGSAQHAITAFWTGVGRQMPGAARA